MTVVDDFLAHYGVKGMKWGVRRKRGSNGLVSTEAERASQLLEKVKKEGGVQSLSNKELGDLNKRLQLERQYSQLIMPKPGPGKIVTDFLADVGKTQAKRAANDLAAKQIQVALAKAAQRKVA